MLFSQRHYAWAEDAMSGADDIELNDFYDCVQRWPDEKDTLDIYGCLITSIACAIKGAIPHRIIDPCILNKIFRIHRVYRYLNEGNECPLGCESQIVWYHALKALNLKSMDLEYKGYPGSSDRSRQYIVRMPNPGVGQSELHFQYVIGLNNDWGRWCPYSEKILEKPGSEVEYKIIELVFRQ